MKTSYEIFPAGDNSVSGNFPVGRFPEIPDVISLGRFFPQVYYAIFTLLTFCMCTYSMSYINVNRMYTCYIRSEKLPTKKIYTLVL